MNVVKNAAGGIDELRPRADMTDDELVRDIRQGNASCLEPLMRRYN